MLIRNWCLFCAGLVALQIFSLAAMPFPPLEPGDAIWHFIAYAALTLLLWIATDGRRPLLVVGVATAVALCDELRQSFVPGRSADFMDFVADAAAAFATGALLRWKTGAKTSCAESSAP
ncbi:MAG TPA: VanZ family protein [Burkholderiales bacterium]|nr:VanZ family protein [Burkholderiales bacterium]